MFQSKTKFRSDQVDTTKTRRRIEDALRKDAGPEILIRVAEALGVEVAFIPEEYPCSDSKRPCFGLDQVRCRHQLKVGHTYLYKYGRNDKGTPFVVVKEPFYGAKYAPDGWWVEVETVSVSGTKFRQTRSLQDANIYPYSGGEWNASNYIAFTSTSRPLACGCYHHCC